MKGYTNIEGGGTMQKALVTSEELAEVLNVIVDWVWRAARNQSIPYYKVGKYYRFDVDDVLGSMAKKQSAHEGEADVIDFPRSSKLVNPRRDIALNR
ncbi:MAG: helix-turn-helix domain-containing protein [Actinobacteria bacterium]|nr:helix-turn-helix domain-containing protein [Actinomycetota bacterium]MCG2819695.1 helix-turn-helix domain-containing protein [Actinomycetes bacterium]